MASAIRIVPHLRSGGGPCGGVETHARCVDLAAAYRARVEIVSVEAPPRVLRARADRRRSPVPDAAVERLVRRVTGWAGGTGPVGPSGSRSHWSRS
ncbi:ATP-binding protein [Nocardiopsis quinghaiensis]|uniref:ATP-binding protein n=1 Tax=Nocardiopsis quinghaiensis TaxID=464995 RepID=UPI001CC2291A|nr:ATP-binding protein [Nocardiopsis quinghaiensis]